MSYGSKWIIAVAIVLGLAVLTQAAQAEEPLDFTQYASCTPTAASDDKEFRFASFECIGITRSNQENKVFENMTALVVGIAKTVGGIVTITSYTKYLDRDGDFVIMEFDESGPVAHFGGTWKILYGTGKWKGMKGSGKHVHAGAGKPIKPGIISQGYDRNTGTFELPK